MPPVAKRKAPTTPVKASQRRDSGSSFGSGSALDLSDDGGYSAVEEISDQEDDDEDDVNAAEEEHMRINPQSTPARPQYAEAAQEEDGDESSVEGEAYESTSWGGIPSEPDETVLPEFYEEAVYGSEAMKRHVRFDLPSSESESTDTEDDHRDIFPDIFVSQNSLDPAFRREIEHDRSDSEGSWEGNPYQAYHSGVGDASSHGAPTADQSGATDQTFADAIAAAEDEAASGLDGYETDGETTEEDIPEPPIRRKTRRPSLPMSEDTDSDEDFPTQALVGQPRVGSFDLDRSVKKPIAVLNPRTRKIMLFTPQGRRQLDLSPEQFNLTWSSHVPQSSPLAASSSNLMFGAMPANGLAHYMSPSNLPSAFTFDESSDMFSGPEEGDDAELNLDISDFIAWDDDDNEEATPTAQTSGKGKAKAASWDSTPVAMPSSEPEVLSHLNSETVGAFRRNQVNQQLLLSSQATQDSLAFSGPYNHMAVRGLRSDRFDTAGIPLTPVRRPRQRADSTGSMLEPPSPAKRKASSEATASMHKRHRSISDVNHLRIL